MQKKLAGGECDIAFMQNDVTNDAMSRILTLEHKEVGFLACHKNANVKSTTDLKDKTVYIGSDQTGSQYTFNRLNIETNVDTNSSTMEFLANHFQDEHSCLFSISTENFIAFDLLDKLNNFTLVPISDVQYESGYISNNKFQNLTDGKYIGMFYNSNGWFKPNGTPTILIGTSLVSTRDWLKNNTQLGEIIMLNRETLQQSLQ